MKEDDSGRMSTSCRLEGPLDQVHCTRVTVDNAGGLQYQIKDNDICVPEESPSQSESSAVLKYTVNSIPTKR